MPPINTVFYRRIAMHYNFHNVQDTLNTFNLIAHRAYVFLRVKCEVNNIEQTF